MMSAYEYDCYEDMRAFFTVLYGSALKGNPFLQKALLTGIQRISKENAYHMIMLGMCTYLDSCYDIKSNIETGDGRCDIMLRALNNKYINVLIEFKEGKNVEQLAAVALKQIHDKRYYVNLEGETLLLGIAHNKKQVHIEYEIIKN